MGYISALTYYSLLLLDAAAAELVDKAGGPVVDEAGGPVVDEAGGSVVDKAGGPVLYEAGRPVVSVVGTAEDKWTWTVKNIKKTSGYSNVTTKQHCPPNCPSTGVMRASI